MRFPRRRTDGSTSPERPNGRVGLGLVLIGTGRPAGFAQFGGSREAFLASLAPVLGFLIVLSGVVGWNLGAGSGLSTFLSGVCALLAPAVIADLLCRRWERRQHWALYANVLNCAQWLMGAVFILLMPAVSLALSLGLSVRLATMLLVLAVGVYLMWFHWFAARHTLDLSRGRALLVMLCVVFGTGLLIHGPKVLAGKKIDSLLIVDPTDK